MGTLGKRPLLRYSHPAYPTRLEVLAQPALLRERQPPAWRTNAELAAIAAALVAAQAAGCRQPAPTARSASALPPPPATSQPGVSTSARAALAEDDPVVVSPLFLHGSGHGVTGCVVMNPPQFLSEEEALPVIIEELRRSGIEITDRNTALGRISIPLGFPLRTVEVDENGEATEYTEQNQGLLTIDGYDATQRIAFVYASSTDFERLGGPWNTGWSSVRDYDLPQVATWIASQVAGKPEGFVLGLLYDPVTEAASLSRLHAEDRVPDAANLPEWKEWFEVSREKGSNSPEAVAAYERAQVASAPLEARREQARAAERAEAAELSKQQLRAQVRDFVAWLKGQGII